MGVSGAESSGVRSSSLRTPSTLPIHRPPLPAQHQPLPSPLMAVRSRGPSLRPWARPPPGPARNLGPSHSLGPQGAWVPPIPWALKEPGPLPFPGPRPLPGAHTPSLGAKPSNATLPLFCFRRVHLPSSCGLVTPPGRRSPRPGLRSLWAGAPSWLSAVSPPSRPARSGGSGQERGGNSAQGQSGRRLGGSARLALG